MQNLVHLKVELTPYRCEKPVDALHQIECIRFARHDYRGQVLLVHAAGSDNVHQGGSRFPACFEVINPDMKQSAAAWAVGIESDHGNSLGQRPLNSCLNLRHVIHADYNTVNALFY